MSHIVTVQTRVQDPAAVTAACQRLALAAPTTGKVKLFAGVAEGLIVQLPAWRYPIVIEPATGTIKYDNYGGEWGAIDQLNRFLQAYAVEKTRLEARRRGHSVIEQALADGSIKLSIQVAASTG